MIKYDAEYFDPRQRDENDIDRIQIAMIPDGARVLEIGCATGFMSSYLEQEKGCHLVGVEADSEQATLAATRCQRLVSGSIEERSVQMEIDGIVADNGGFDVVFMSQVIEHLARPDAVLIRSRQWLRPGGELIISTCNIAHWHSRLRLMRGIWVYEAYGIFDESHLRFFTVESLEKTLEQSGFRVVERGYSYGDVHPFFFVPGLRRVELASLLGVLPFVGSLLQKAYRRSFLGLLTYQFVYRAVACDSGFAHIKGLQ